MSLRRYGLPYIKDLVLWLLALSLSLVIFLVLPTHHTANTDAVVETIPVGIHPNDIAFNPENNRMYVANFGKSDCDSFAIFGEWVGTSSVSVIDESYNVQRVDVGEDCLFGIAFNEANRRMYVTTSGDDSVIMIDGLSQRDPVIGVEDNPRGIAFNRANNLIYVANMMDNDISVIRDASVEAEIEFDETLPYGLAYNPINELMYVTNQAKESVSTINTRGEVTTIPDVGLGPRGIAFAENDRMYVAASGDNSVTMIDTTSNRVVGEPIKVGYNPNDVVYNPFNKKIYVSNSGDNTVSVIDTTSNRVAQPPIRVGSGPFGMAYNPVNHEIYVANWGEDTVSVIDVTSQWSTQLALNNRTICPEPFVQHWDKIIFKINSTQLAQSLNLTANTELDIKIQDDPDEITDIKQRVLDFLGESNATKDTISIIDVDHSVVCASSSSTSSEVPTVQIISPTNRSQFSPAQMVNFTGQARDAEDGELTGANLVWLSDRDGLLGTGNQISVALSGPPTPCVPQFLGHIITLEATDRDGNSASSKILVSIGDVC